MKNYKNLIFWNYSSSRIQ